MAAQYHSLFTTQGLALLREAIQTGAKLGITHMAYGDGNGIVPTPNADFTKLVKEVYRTPLNRLAPSKENANWLEADGVIPSAVGGFNIREVGLYAGTVLVAYANYPATYKPSADQGTAQIKTIRIVLQIDNTANFELKIDASVVMATIQAVDDAKVEIYENTVGHIESISDLTDLKKWDGRSVLVKSYLTNLGAGGGTFVYDSSKSNINDFGLTINGWVRQDQTCITPDMFGCIPNKWEFDNTTLLNAALATGRDIYGKPDNIYTCNGNLRSKGQRLIGGWKIRSSKNTSRAGTWNQTVTTVDDTNVNNDILKLLYVSSAWCLAEFLAIKNLGFNTICHYGAMSVMGWDNDGNVYDLLNNARAAGLKVLLGTGALTTIFGSSEALVAAVDKYPAMWGYAIYDEPVLNAVTVVQQDEKIALYRKLTSRIISTVDYAFSVTERLLSKNYDLLLADIYAEPQASTVSYADALEIDLQTMRLALGVFSRQYDFKVLPCVMGFKYVGNTAAQLPRIIEGSKIFAKACGGNFACFAWDGDSDLAIETSVRNSGALQDMCKDICNHKNTAWNVPIARIWGNISWNGQNQGVKDLLDMVMIENSYHSPEVVFLGKNAYANTLEHGTAETDSTTTNLTTGQGVQGLMFKGAKGVFVTKAAMKKYNTFCIQTLSFGATLNATIVLAGTTLGYGLGTTLHSYKPTGGVDTFTFKNNDLNDSLVITCNDQNASEFFRTMIRGAWVTSNW